MPAKTTRDAQLALLLPMAISQGWTVRDFAKRAGIEFARAGELLRKGAQQVASSMSQVVTIDALALTIPHNGGNVTLGKLQGEIVTGAITALAETPPNPREWTPKDIKGYTYAHRILKDAQALGLIRFGEQKEGGIPPAMRAIDPFLSQAKEVKHSESENSPTESESVNDGADSSPPVLVDTPPAQGEGGE